MRWRALLLLAGALLVVAALAAAWLGRGLLALPAAAARQDAAWAGAVVHPDRRDASVRLAAALDQRDRSRSFLRVVRLFRAATIVHRNGLLAQAPVDAEASIAKLVPTIRSGTERAQAEVMLGILLALTAGNGAGTLDNGQGTGGNLLLGQALTDFQEAVRSDGANEDAKVDLELLLQQAAKSKERSKPNLKPGKGQKGRKKPPPARGTTRPATPQASFANPGTGY